MANVSKERAIKGHVYMAVESFAAGFQSRHEREVDDPEGTLNMKIHNVFIAALGPEIQYYTALVRSLDSSLGNVLERLAINIAGLSFDVKKSVEGPLTTRQTEKIAKLLERYKRREKAPEVKDYAFLREQPGTQDARTKRHDSDYYLTDQEAGGHYLIELKIGGDLDNKKARSEKEALLEQFAILSNTVPKAREMRIYFATAYNRYGEGQPWRQERVRQFFAAEELLIGKDFWNFICRSDAGYDTVLGAYKERAHLILKALNSIKETYLG